MLKSFRTVLFLPLLPFVSGFPACHPIPSDPDVPYQRYVGTSSADTNALLQDLGGDLHEPGFDPLTPFPGFDSAAIGSFGLQSAAVDDFRTTPGSADLDVGDGEISASVSRRNELRRVDPSSGLFLRGDAAPGASCATGAEADCYEPGDPLAQNAELFAALCHWSRNFTVLDPAACALDIFNAQTLVGGVLPIATALSSISTGDPVGAALLNTLLGLLAPPAPGANNLPLVDLGPAFGAPAGATLDDHLSPAQQRVLGCGPLAPQSASCQTGGIQLLHAEASAITSSWHPPGIGGAGPQFHCFRFVPGAGFVALPGCRGLPEARACSRSNGEGGIDILPGCRAQADDGYDASVDGVPSLIGVPSSVGSSTVFSCPIEGDGGWCDGGHPFTGVPWATVLDAYSWNLQVLLVALSALGTGDGSFDPSDPLNVDACSFRRPELCSFVQAVWSMVIELGAQDPRGAPLRRWLWEAGASYHVDSAEGALAAAEGGVLHAMGPSSVNAGTPLLLLGNRDGDPLFDYEDNCIRAANPGQEDRDLDRFGDACDCDFNHDQVCNSDDADLLVEDFIDGLSNTAGTDMNGDGVVDVDDVMLFLPGFTSGLPGPSGPAIAPGSTSP